MRRSLSMIGRGMRRSLEHDWEGTEEKFEALKRGE